MKVDVSLNIFAKPYQTALALLSLLKHSGEHIDKIYLQFEPAGSRFDAVPPYAMAEYLGARAIVTQPEIWIECDAVDKTRLGDSAYRQSLRYQAAFEHTDKDFLFMIHNDVFIKKDIIGTFLGKIDGAFAIGPLGQCWNCPASMPEVMQAAGLGEPCNGERYQEFKPSFAQMEHLYAVAREQGAKVRPYWEGWDEFYRKQAWPLPECRVNEWACLIDMKQTRHLTRPFGDILPFGAYEPCGSVTLDISVPWFRELNQRGLFARNFDVSRYLHHFVGSFRVVREEYLQAEEKARIMLEKGFPDFVIWCRERKNGMF